MTLLIFLIVLSLLIFVHEFGHFWAARRAGIKVEEFGFGFPPRVWGKKIGETVYSINALPIGGFVRLYGEEEAPEKDRDRSFYFKPRFTRVLVIVAGVLMNFLLGFLLFSLLYMRIGVPTPTDEVAVVGFTSREDEEETPAQKAGLKPGDKIVAIEGEKIETIEHIQEKSKEFAGQPMEVTLERSELLFLFTGAFEVDEPERLVIEVVPREDAEKGQLGVWLHPGLIRKTQFFGPVLTPVKAIEVGVRDGIAFSGLIVVGVYETLKNLIVSGVVPEDIAGPVGIFQLTKEAAQQGSLVLLSFVGVLSVNLAVLNILPFPALDGGRLLFIVVESIFGRRVLPRFERIAHATGIAILLLLLILITIHDVGRILSGGFNIFSQPQ